MDALNRLSQRITENIHETTRDLTFQGSSKDLYDTNDDRTQEITKLLESSHDREKVMGMKRLIALISKGRPVASFFPLVVKQVSSPSLELRKLVYIYILRHASLEPDLALLSINTFQKDLNDPNPLMRCMALRVLGGIRVPMIGSVVTMAVRKGAGDVNPYVRKAAALAIPKLYETDATHHHTLLPILQLLLQERSPIAIGSVLVAFQVLCPFQLDLLHPHFRRLCGMLVEADEWAQVVMMDVLGRYARVMLEKPKNEPNETASETDGPEPDPDLLLLFHSSLPLMHSSSPAVILSLTKLHHVLSPPSPSPLPHLAPPLLRLLDTPQTEGVKLAILKTCRALVRQRKDVFEDEEVGEGRWRAFLVDQDDGTKLAVEKIGMLRALVDSGNENDLLDEFLHYERSTNNRISEAAIEAIGFLSTLNEGMREKATKHLLKLLRKKRDSTLTATILVLKNLILSTPSSSDGSADLVARLAGRLSEIKNGKARACVVGLVGEHPGEQGRMGAEVLRTGVQNFIQEGEEVKLALLTLTSKLLLISTDRLSPITQQVHLLASHVFALARYDPSYDVRDRSRFLKSLVKTMLVDAEPRPSQQEEEDAEAEGETGGVVLRREQIGLVLGGQRVPGSKGDLDSSPSSLHMNAPSAEISTLSLSTQPHYLPSYAPTPDWQEQGTDPSLRTVTVGAEMVVPRSNASNRDEERSRPPAAAAAAVARRDVRQTLPRLANRAPGVGGVGAKPKKEVDLDRFYASGTESEESSDEDEGSLSEDSTDSEGDSSEEEEEEEDEESEDESSRLNDRFRQL